MKSYFDSLVLGAVIAIGWVTSAQAALPIQQLDSYKGAKAYLVQTQSLPMLDIEISIDAGSRYDPTAKAGLASLTGELLNKGIRSSKSNLTEAQILAQISMWG